MTTATYGLRAVDLEVTAGLANVNGSVTRFDLAQTDRFVFAQPPLTSVNPAIAGRRRRFRC